MDMASGYFQVELHPDDREKSAFSTPTGHYEFKRMAMGLRNAPSTWQRLMYSVFSGLVGLECLVYLDDVIVFSTSDVKEHLQRLRDVFDRMRQANLKLKPTKCNFLMKEAKYLGHIISVDSQGVSVLSMFNTEEMEKLAESTIAKMWGWLSWIGNITSGMIGLYIVWRVLKWILEVVINAITIHQTHGWSFKLLASFWDSLTLWFLHLKHKKEVAKNLTQQTPTRTPEPSAPELVDIEVNSLSKSEPCLATQTTQPIYPSLSTSSSQKQVTFVETPDKKTWL
ncbi:uncharacterized protein LOC123009115 [Tribolium madens]|uniref:uncharacterized protein LOC123009115 n=1 Tax=Tribolium madens TaxID=41895 RepID=UPI001CF72B45|nr:uncharacterized protein LOC123009115 [Tribolium madens]